jgi:UDP-N-acetylglucosamine 2-epimerase (non-hydrolysing)
MLPLVKEIEATDGLEGRVCITAQHREMLDQIMEVFDVRADSDLDVMRPGQTLTSITSDVLEGLEKVLLEEKPDIVLVHGDTTTGFVAALAAFYQQIPVGHVEAGLRTNNIYSPFPEEANRQLISRIASLHFAPTELNKLNLEAEGISKHVYVTGNTVIDAFATTVQEDYLFKNEELARIDLQAGRTILLTAHRRENLGKPLQDIFQAVRELAENYPDLQFVYPVHRNPLVSGPAQDILGDHPRVHLIDPIDAEDMHNLISRCYLVLTDSGGLQEEAPTLGKPVIVLRTETERPEAVEAGVARVVGVDKNDIISAVSTLLEDVEEYSLMSRAVNPYGDGQASKRICTAIKFFVSST